VLNGLRSAESPTGSEFPCLGASLISQKGNTESNLSTFRNNLDRLKPFDPGRPF